MASRKEPRCHPAPQSRLAVPECRIGIPCPRSVCRTTKLTGKDRVRTRFSVFPVDDVHFPSSNSRRGCLPTSHPRRDSRAGASPKNCQLHRPEGARTLFEKRVLPLFCCSQAVPGRQHRAERPLPGRISWPVWPTCTNRSDKTRRYARQLDSLKDRVAARAGGLGRRTGT